MAFARPDVNAAYARLSQAFTNIEELITTVALISGIYFIMRGIMMYRAFGSSASSHGKGEIAGPMVYIVIGAVLCNLSYMQSSALLTVFGDSQATQFTSSTLSYFNDSSMVKWDALADMLGKFLKLIGYIAFVRGWFMLAKMGHSGEQPGSIAKGITHIVGGIFLLNLTGTVKIIAGTFGF